MILRVKFQGDVLDLFEVLKDVGEGFTVDYVSEGIYSIEGVRLDNVRRRLGVSEIHNKPYVKKTLPILTAIVLERLEYAKVGTFAYDGLSNLANRLVEISDYYTFDRFQKDIASEMRFLAQCDCTGCSKEIKIYQWFLRQAQEL